MCGRYAFYSPEEAVTRLFSVEFSAPIEPRYNIAPTQWVPAIRFQNDNGEAAAAGVMLKWGLVPFWAGDTKIGNRMINARAETVAEKPAYRAAYKRRRCLVLADGFYEWQAGRDGKTPWFISQRNAQPFAMAGLWERWDKGEDGPLETCTIITTESNTLVSEIHKRMPVILDTDAAIRWIDHRTDVSELAPLLAPCAPGRLTAWPVTKVVNSPANEGPELIQPAGDPIGLA